MKKHKTTIPVFICALSTLIIMGSPIKPADPIEKERKLRMANSIPIQAGICDYIGVGRVTNTWPIADWLEKDNVINIAVDNWWHGDTGNDNITVYMIKNDPPPKNIPLLFFVSKDYGTMFRVEQPTGYMLFQYVFGGDSHEPTFRPLRINSKKTVFFNDDESWFHINEENTGFITFASNLVFAAKSQNTNEFYKIIRDGYRLNPQDSRISEDSLFALENWNFYMSTNFIQEIWSDPLLEGEARQRIRDGNQRSYRRTLLP